jgi:hypothetical protein
MPSWQLLIYSVQNQFLGNLRLALSHMSPPGKVADASLVGGGDYSGSCWAGVILGDRRREGNQNKNNNLIIHLASVCVTKVYFSVKCTWVSLAHL